MRSRTEELEEDNIVYHESKPGIAMKISFMGRKLEYGNYNVEVKFTEGGEMKTQFFDSRELSKRKS